jgi:histidine triad (HIT) family protein
MTDCVFCKIARGEQQEYVVYEDSDVIAFFSNRPIAKGHTLVVPKKHFVNIFDVDAVSLERVTAVAQKLAQTMQKALGVKGVDLVNASGAAAGQGVFHFHLHLIPRKEGDGVKISWKVTRIPRKELEVLVRKMRRQSARD